MSELETLGRKAKAAARDLALRKTSEKNKALFAIADALEQGADRWLAANAEDVAAARESGMRASMLDRLSLTKERIAGIADGVRQVAALPDPVGAIDQTVSRPNGLIISRQRVPLGVIGIIYEARPNVTADAAALTLKSGNACILRGGKEAIQSNRVCVELMRDALKSAGFPSDAIALVQSTDRETARELMHLNDYLDVLIPRGGAGLIRSVAREASVPVIRTGEGVCHVYIDEHADLQMGSKILENAKCSRPSVCNAAECVLIHASVLEAFLTEARPWLDARGVSLHCDERALAVLGERGIPAVPEDWDSEYGDLTLAVKTVDSFEEAVEFIAAHGSGHSEAIVTRDYDTARRFLSMVDAAAVYVNASTRFTDGGEFGLGAEIGISTQKLHARGPMGLEALTSWKYLVLGDGQIR